MQLWPGQLEQALSRQHSFRIHVGRTAEEKYIKLQRQQHLLGQIGDAMETF
jgi:hypothetical protein